MTTSARRAALPGSHFVGVKRDSGSHFGNRVAGFLNASEKVLPPSRVATASTRKIRGREIILDASVDYQRCEQVVRDVMDHVSAEIIDTSKGAVSERRCERMVSANG